MRGAVGTLDQEESMRTFVVAVAAATIMAVSSYAKPAAAITLGGADGLRPAIEDTGLVDQVHCRPGWRHHWNGWRWTDGCYYGYRSNYFYSYPRYRSRRVFIGRSFVSRSHVNRSFVSRSHVSRSFVGRSRGRRR
jgi:hypothetical protein